ncbi:hypothetical protein AB4Y89_13965 [Terriglobus sp. 2YAB30_2]|uniref:hypothetical protein n=1 Tax=unclassified Terriglobus TaxID=2628988 RepID=UPI003F98F4B9
MDNTIPDSAAINEELQRLVSHRFLRQSPRLVLFLKHIVEKTVRGEGDQLKERNVGTEVFGKGRRYDPATDSTVRVAASELRKRLALYYQEPEHARELRFTLPVGAYTPAFHWPSTEEPKPASETPAASAEAPSAGTLPETPQQVTARPRYTFWLWAGFPALVVVIFASVFLLSRRSSGEAAVDSFWEPLLHTSTPVVVLVAGHPYSTMYIRDAENPARESTLDMSQEQGINTVTFDDMESLIIVTGYLHAHHVPYVVRDESQVTITDLRNGPVVVIGAFCNSWALRLLKPLRFHFGNDPDMTSYWIEDGESRSESKWVVNRQKQLATNDFVDYAIVGRYRDPNLGQPVVIVSGIAGGNNINAAQVLTDPAFLSQLFGSSNAKKGDKNFEAVLSAKTVNNHSGQPRIEASYSW